MHVCCTPRFIMLIMTTDRDRALVRSLGTVKKQTGQCSAVQLHAGDAIRAGVHTCTTLAEGHPICIVVVPVAAGVEPELRCYAVALFEVAAKGISNRSGNTWGCARQPQALCGGSAACIRLDEAGADRAGAGGLLDETSAVATYTNDKISMRAMGTLIQEALCCHVIPPNGVWH